MKENIFEAHRSHLYQFLGNEAGVNKLLISFLYGFIQVVIGLVVLQFTSYSVQVQIVFSIILLTILSLIYLSFKTWIIKKYVQK
ncbi:hypothetical protein OKW96_04530 [Sphingobacterium sp. KU25419]|nr:hypothetical protein OKW96_04530 [Sphingobacterium sp. KU25419]